MTMSNQDYSYMADAIKLARKGQYTTHPNPRVGCVIVKNGSIIGKGFHQRAGQPHAEINALRNISDDLNPKDATAYVTLEPCSHTGKTPPCANALIDAGVSRVVIAMQDPNPQVAGKGIQALRDASIEVEVGVLEEQARRLNPGFIKRMETGLPWVRLKLAMSLDGRTAMASGESKWITGSDARQDVQKLRAKADVILTGIGTVLADDPSLNVRLSAEELDIEGEVFQPKRVILDSQLKTPTSGKLLDSAVQGGELIIATISNDSVAKEALTTLGATIINVKKEASGRLALKEVLQQLAAQETNEIHVEAGATLCGALIQAGLVDEIIIYVAPIFMGADARGLLNLPELQTMSDKIQLEIKDIRAVGKDWRLTVMPAN